MAKWYCGSFIVLTIPVLFVVSEFDYDCRPAALTHTWFAVDFRNASSFLSYFHIFILYVDGVPNP